MDGLYPIFYAAFCLFIFDSIMGPAYNEKSDAKKIDRCV